MKDNEKLRDRLAHEYYNREGKPCDDDEVAFMKGWDAAMNVRDEQQSHDQKIKSAANERL